MKFGYLSACFLLFCAGCSSIRVNREYSDLKRDAKKITGADAIWQRYETCQQIEPSIDQAPLSRDEAVAIALQYNPQLQARFEELGIAKADLRQAGFYTNPRIDTVFQLPLSQEGKTGIGFDASMQLSDAWQVPLRRHVAYDQLEITTMLILRLIMDITLETKMAYDTCVYEQKMYQVLTDILKNVQALRDRIDVRQRYGYTSQLDIAMADIAVGRWQAELIAQQARVKQAFVHLRRLLGANITVQPVTVSQQAYMTGLLPSIAHLEKYALEHRPEMHVAELAIQKAEHQWSLEKAKVLDNVAFGISYARDLDTLKGIGPSFGFNLPVFNTNFGNRERARFEVQKAQQEKRAQQLFIQEEVRHAYVQVKALAQQIVLYKESMIPASQQAIDYAQTYFDQMQLNMIVLLDAYQSLLEIKQKIIELELEHAHGMAQLERAGARRLG